MPASPRSDIIHIGSESPIHIAGSALPDAGGIRGTRDNNTEAVVVTPFAFGKDRLRPGGTRQGYAIYRSPRSRAPLTEPARSRRPLSDMKAKGFSAKLVNRGDSHVRGPHPGADHHRSHRVVSMAAINAPLRLVLWGEPAVAAQSRRQNLLLR